MLRNTLLGLSKARIINLTRASADAGINLYRITAHNNLFLRLILVVALLSFAAACGAGSEIVKVSTEADALEIIDVLSKYNIESSKEEVGSDEQKEWMVKVSGDVDTTLVTQILIDHSLPRPKEASEETGSIFVPTEQERKQKELRLKKRDVERQLRQLPGVTSADVTIVPSEDPYFKVEPVPAKANVVLRYKEIKPEEGHVKSMVSSSVERLSADAVNVMLVSVPPRAVPSKAGGKRSGILLAVGIGLVVLIPFLLIVMILQNRRKQISLPQTNTNAEIIDDKDGANLLSSETAQAGKQLRTKTPILLKEGLDESAAKQDVSDQAKSAS